MRYELSPYPDFSWSHSRDRALVECARAYFWRYYGGHGGWLADAPADCRLAYVLKQLTTLPQVLGSALHDCAREAVLATKRREARASAETMLAHVSGALNRAVVGSHHRTRFEREPKRVAMLRDVWYTGRRDSVALVQAATKARTCVRHLAEARVWEELEGCQPAWIVVADSPEAFIHEGWPIYAGPDLIFLPDGRRVAIVDWKTSADADADADLQLPTYALYCRKVLGLPFRDGEWFGRVINLATGDDTTREITRTDLLGAAERIRDSVAAMHGLLVDPERNAPLAREAFSLAPAGRRHECPQCPFYALCEDDLARAEEGER